MRRLGRNTILAIWALGAAPALAFAQARCEVRRPEGTIGLEWLECVTQVGCAVNLPAPGGWTHSFSVEPVVREVARGGPSAGLLRRGDVIVAIDGFLITTEEGGRRLANVTTGIPIVLQVRRYGQVQPVRILPAPGCNEPGITVREGI
jgi:S1-C subfamily serine protease